MAADLIFFYMHIIDPYDFAIVQEIQKNFYSKTRSSKGQFICIQKNIKSAAIFE